MQKFLVVQTAFIGDVVLATAILEKLHQHYPDAQIDFLVRKGNEGLLLQHPWLNEVLVWVKKTHKFRNLFRLIKQVRSNRYDAVITVQRFAATGLLTAFSGAPQRIGFNKNPFSFCFTRSVKHQISTAGKPLHEVERNQQLIAALTDENAAMPRLYPSAADRDKVAALQAKPYLVIAPASVWYTKQFPASQWAAFLNKLSPGWKVYLIGAGSDKELAENIRNNSSYPEVENLCGRLSFLESAALQQGARMNFVNDSAPLHFASAVNAAVTAVYCSTLPAFGFGPLATNSRVIEVEEQLACRPCGLHGRPACPHGHFKCALDIRSAQLLEAVPSLH